MVSVGINIVDDSGDAFNDFTTIKDQWNMVPFPSRISIGRYFRSGIGLEAIATYNKYKEGFIIDRAVNPEDKDYYAIDARLSYDLNKLLGQTAWFDPYVGGGIGYTDANDIGRGTYNAVIGSRLWFSDRWALDLNSSGKWSFGSEATNHIQHAAGVVYQFDIEKDLSKKGREKLALIQEQERIADSIAAAKKAEEEAKALAERLEREKEAARLAAEEKARQEAEAKRKQAIADSIEALRQIYYDFDSSYLNDPSRAPLEQLAAILREHPEVRIRFEAHADARGPEQYNQWLSERRAMRAKTYLLEKGIADERMETLGYGETRILNECTNGVRCSEAKHRENRRSAFIVVNL